MPDLSHIFQPFDSTPDGREIQVLHLQIIALECVGTEWHVVDVEQPGAEPYFQVTLEDKGNPSDRPRYTRGWAAMRHGLVVDSEWRYAWFGRCGDHVVVSGIPRPEYRIGPESYPIRFGSDTREQISGQIYLLLAGQRDGFMTP